MIYTHVAIVKRSSSLVMDMATRVQMLDEAVCEKKKRVKENVEAVFISHSTNALGKGMNQIILPPAIGKIVG